MDIGLIRDGLGRIDKGNVVRVICDVLLHNIDKIDTFSEKDMYYRDDVVYTYDNVNDKHKLYLCTVNKVNPGPFNSTQWTEYVFRLVNKLVLLEGEYVAAADGVSTFPVNQPLFEFDRDVVTLHHSVRGRLMQGRDWNLSADKANIVLSGFTLYKNDTILIEIFKVVS